MKRLSILLCVFLIFLSGCASKPTAQIAATTLPVYEITAALCEGTGLQVTRLITESVSCLHDYSLNVRQVKAAEAAQVIVLSGAGLEDFWEAIPENAHIIDASNGIDLLESHEEHAHDHEHEDEHDPHIWLSPANAIMMAKTISYELCKLYPAYDATIEANLNQLLQQLEKLDAYAQEQLASLRTRELITFHDGFSYFADSMGLTILEAVEEESGSEASAQELKELITIVREHNLPAIFVEANGSDSAAQVIARETGAHIFTLDMGMSGDSFIDAMYRNIDTILEALG